MGITIWPIGYKPSKEDLKGLYNYRWETPAGLMLDCYLSYEAEERETQDEPGCAASMELECALVEGVDISEVLDGLWAEMIENQALNNLADQIKDVAFERGQDRGES